MSKHSETLQEEKKKNFSNNNMYRTKPFGISCTLHSVQRRSTNRDTALSHTTTSAWFVFAHVSHSSEEAWGKETQHVRDNVRQTIKKNLFFSKLQKKNISKTPKYSNHKKDPHQWCTTNPHPLTNATNVAPYSTTSARTMYLANRYFKNGVSVLRRTFDFFSFSPDDKRWSWWLV